MRAYHKENQPIVTPLELYKRAWDIETEVLEDCEKHNANRLSVIYLIRERERILKAVKEDKK